MRLRLFVSDFSAESFAERQFYLVAVTYALSPEAVIHYDYTSFATRISAPSFVDLDGRDQADTARFQS